MAPQSSLAEPVAMEPRAAIRVLLVNRSELVRRELRTIMAADGAIVVIGERRDVGEGSALALGAGTTVVVTDVASSLVAPAPAGADGAASSDARAEATAPGVLIVSRRAHPGSVRACLNAGALGYLLEEAAADDLLPAIRAVAAGRRYFSDAVARLVIEHCASPDPAVLRRDPFWLLTSRERQVLQLIAEGRSQREIARLLSMRPATVATHRRAVMARHGLHNTAQVVRFAIRCGLVR
jgi:DNA-binding NarL/FixJ family response regulator